VALVNTYAPAHDIAEARIKKLEEEHDMAEARIKKLEEEKSKLEELVERLFEHISSEAVYTSGLRLELRMAKEIINGG
jgi:predicted nuclease with TOPRIM domain